MRWNLVDMVFGIPVEIRLGDLRKKKQLYEHWSEITSHQTIFNRSIFLMCDIYNNLPQHIVDTPSVHLFQKALTFKARQRCEDGNADWALSFSRRAGPDV